MRFVAVTSSLNLIEHFKSACLVVSKLSEQVIFKISDDSFNLIADDNYHNFISGARCRLSKSLFQEYKFNGLNSRHNYIYFKIESGALQSCFSKFKHNDSFKCMRFLLVNIKDGFGFRIIYQLPDTSGSKIFTETLHVRIIKHAEWSKYDEELFQDVRVSCTFESYFEISQSLFFTISGFFFYATFQRFSSNNTTTCKNIQNRTFFSKI